MWQCTVRDKRAASFVWLMQSMSAMFLPLCQVLYFKYAGDNMETPDGTKYIVLRNDDILVS